MSAEILCCLIRFRRAKRFHRDAAGCSRSLDTATWRKVHEDREAIYLMHRVVRMVLSAVPLDWKLWGAATAKAERTRGDGSEMSGPRHSTITV
jgi:hypothetical protein